MNQQLVHLIIVLIIVGGSVMKVIFTKLQEQAAKRRAQMAAEQRRLEGLRTGRDAEAARPRPLAQTGRPAQTELEELARRRAAQLEELRRVQQQRRQSAGAQPARPTPQGGVILRVPGSAGPTVPGTRAPLPPPPGPMTRPSPPAPRVPRQKARPQRPAPVTPRQRPAPTRPEAAPPPEVEGESSTRRRVVAEIEQTEAPKAPRPHLPVAPGSRAPDWRRAILMAEILSAPVALRAGEPGPLARRF